MSYPPYQSEFPESNKEAEERFKRFEHFDPFKNIPPALLNSNDISKYVKEVGIIYPFNREEGKLKSASYEIDFIGTVYFWKDEDTEYYKTQEIERNQRFTVPKNSIVYIYPKTVIRLPDYIALRFNLRIKHVHRGLLLGTGPLVDPGFAGQLFIPLHNLTSEPYTLTGGEGLIWVEFTKISPHPYWETVGANDEGYKRFPPEHRYMEPRHYLSKISTMNGDPARSSIPLEIKEAKDASTKAIKRVRLISWGGGIAVGIAIIGMVIGMVLPIISLTLDANKYVKESREYAETTSGKLIEQEDAIADLRKQLLELKAEKQK
jgi:deoxycytidine triphosphate deaminase